MPRPTTLGAIPIKETPITFSPELISAAMQRHELDLFTVWTVCREMDSRLGGGGVMTVQLIRWACEVVLGISDKYAYAKFTEGVGTYWHTPNGARGKQVTGLVSAAKVTGRLSPTMARTRPFVVKLGQIITDATDKGWSQTRALLFSMVAGAADASKPVANATLQAQTGMSRSSVKRLRRGCPHLKTVRNFSTVTSCDTEADAIDVRGRLISKGTQNPYRIIRAGEKFLILRQLGNAYALPELSRLPLRKRLKAMKAFDAHNDAVCRPRRFLDTPKSRTSAIEYFTPSDIPLKGIIARARLWDRHGPTLSDGILNSPPRHRAGERWEHYKRYITSRTDFCG